MAVGSPTVLNDYTQTARCTNSSSTGTSVSLITILPASITLANGDAISCTVTNTKVSPPTLSLQKALGTTGRAKSGDQFTVQILSGGAAVNSTTTATTTSGAGDTVAVGSGYTGVFSGTAGTTYTLAEIVAVGSTAVLAQYTQTARCTNSSSTGTSVGFVTTLPASITLANGDAISCTVTNTAIVAPKFGLPTLSLQKALGTTGRAKPGDQFTVQILSGGTVVNSTTTATTTTGAGDSVAVGSGFTGVFSGTAGTTYTLAEIAAVGSTAVLAQYTQTARCTNSFNTGTSVGFVTTLPASITLANGDAISCTVTNTAATAPTLSLQKALGGNRIDNNDQFALSGTVNGVSTGSTVTTSGSGASIGSPAFSITATVGNTYTMTEAMAAGTSLLTQYSQSVACSNTGPTAVGTFTSLPISVKPVNGDAIVCTVTNTPKVISFSLQVTLGISGRIAAADQFTLSGTGYGATAPVTTTGTGATVTGGSYNFIAISGNTYILNVAMANGSVSALNQYIQIVSCVNTGPTNVSGIISLPIKITPVNGDTINCAFAPPIVAVPVPTTSTLALLLLSLMLVASTGLMVRTRR